MILVELSSAEDSLRSFSCKFINRLGSIPMHAMTTAHIAALACILDIHLLQMVAGVKKIETKTIDSSMEKIGEDGQVCYVFICICVNEHLYTLFVF